MSKQGNTQQLDALIDAGTMEQLRAALRAVRSKTWGARQPLTVADFPIDGSASDDEARYEACRELAETIDDVIGDALVGRL
ncbi:hypothetical protein [Streptomyces sp. NPDC015125]|uniref:hypothetical protein n=1 Tax=Streptomyces sp. NPDC015125 TaxID=3364938 RepID=UPI0037024E46